MPLKKPSQNQTLDKSVAKKQISPNPKGTPEEKANEEKAFNRLSARVEKFFELAGDQSGTILLNLAVSDDWYEPETSTSANAQFTHSLAELENSLRALYAEQVLAWSRDLAPENIFYQYGRGGDITISDPSSLYKKIDAHSAKVYKSITALVAYNNKHKTHYAKKPQAQSKPAINALIYSGLCNVFDAAIKVAKAEVNLRKKNPGEKSKNAALGRWAWPGERIGRQRVPTEQDTPVERELFKHLDAHFNLNNPLKDEDVAVLQSILKKGQYSDVIKEPTVEVVYRGFDVPAVWLAKKLGYKSVKALQKVGTIEKKFTFWPRKGSATSWTTSKNIAKEFWDATSASSVSIILHARVSDNRYKFVSGPGGLYNVSFGEEYEYEKEAIGLGPIKVFKIEYAWERDAFDTYNP